MYETMVFKSVPTSTSIINPDSLPPSPSTSAPIMSHDPEALIFLASWTETETTPKRERGAQ